MRTVELITALFSEVDEQMGAISTHPEAPLWGLNTSREDGAAVCVEAHAQPPVVAEAHARYAVLSGGLGRVIDHSLSSDASDDEDDDGDYDKDQRNQGNRDRNAPERLPALLRRDVRPPERGYPSPLPP